MLEFWRSEVQNGSLGVKSRYQHTCVPFGSCKGNILFLCLFQLLGAACIPWLMAPSYIFKGGSVASIFKYSLSLTSAFFFFFFLERILSRLYAQHGLQHGAWSHNPEIMTWAEIKSRMLSQLSYPAAPLTSAFVDTSPSLILTLLSPS